MSIKVEISDQTEQPVLSVRKRMRAADLPKELASAYKAIADYLCELGATPQGPAFAAYYNMDMEDLDTEMGFPVHKPIAGKGDIIKGSIPAGKQASCMHKGPYAEIGSAYEAMTAWVTENGYTPAGVCYEFYYNSPLEVPEGELLTKIVFLLK